MKKRDYGLDLLRIVLCIFVIMLHSLAYFGDLNKFIGTYFPTIIGSANVLFFVISGYLNLEKNFKSNKDIIDFYKTRFIYVVLPFLGFNLFWVIWDYMHANGSFDLLGVAYDYYDMIMGEAAKGHMWFMYPYFGLLLATPFLSKMLHAMDNKELKTLWYLGLGFNACYYFLCENMGLHFRVSAWFLEGWALYYVTGYIFRHVLVNESPVKWTILCLLGYFATVLGGSGKLTFFKYFEGVNDLQPMFTLFCIGLLYIWNRFVKINNDKVGKVISYIGYCTYLIYLFHVRGIEYAGRKLNIVEPSLTNGLIVVLGAFIFSLIASMVINFVMKPAQDFLKKKLVTDK
ncbi:MAG: acyltransferase [Erysipelotrichaceae bacterium]|nr:acyltransferase [Erysipelotrichaceae bacterium]